MMRLIITGVPGTGKTTLAKKIAKDKNLQYIGINDIVDEHHLYFKIDKSDGSKVVDMKRLNDYIRNHVIESKGFVLEGHLACEIEIPADYVVVLRTHPNTLKKRYSKRKYGQQKVKDNVTCEILDYCLIKTEENYKEAEIIEYNTTNKKIDKAIEDIYKLIEGKKKSRHINWATRLYKKNINFMAELDNL